MSECTLTWLSNRQMYRELRKVAKKWPKQDVKGVEKLGLVLFEIWSARRGLQPFPEVCLLSRDGRFAGVLCGAIDFHQHNFNIQHLIVTQSIDNNQIDCDMVQNKLVEAAIDLSQSYGFQGWVSCAPDEAEVPIFKKMGFSVHRDSLTYRRMGYFTRL